MTDAGKQKAREWLKAHKPKPPERPTITELEELLSHEDGTPVEINLDGSIGVGADEREVERLAAYGRQCRREALEAAVTRVCKWCALRPESLARACNGTY